MQNINIAPLIFIYYLLLDEFSASELLCQRGRTVNDFQNRLLSGFIRIVSINIVSRGNTC